MEHSNILENEVVHLWNEQVQRQRIWSDSEGNQVEIIYPGRLNDSRGGDFRDVLIRSKLGNYHGCIEVHTRASGWKSHGHHLDPAYNKVVLHVVWEKDCPGQILLQNGKSIPTVILNRPMTPGKSVSSSKDALPCSEIGSRWSSRAIQEVLEYSGNLRFETAAGTFQADILHDEAAQILFQGILEALGYSKNRVPFKALAGFLPLFFLEEITRASDDKKNMLLKLQAILFGKAGLLPSQRLSNIPIDAYINSLETTWSDLSLDTPLHANEWELFKVRPGNYPIRRIIALSHLLYNWRKKGCLESLLELVRSATGMRAHFYLESFLVVSAEGYWKEHFDFGSPQGKQNSFILGRSRAAEIIINVLLPFSVGWGWLKADPDLIRKARQIYRGYPRLESNSLERHMLNQLTLDHTIVNSACLQQGLTQIYKTLCTQGKCQECSYSK